ncbi:hypothetical protein MHYP_G00050950 [Metynnis hypsauchen]
MLVLLAASRRIRRAFLVKMVSRSAARGLSPPPPPRCRFVPELQLVVVVVLHGKARGVPALERIETVHF